MKKHLSNILATILCGTLLIALPSCGNIGSSNHPTESTTEINEQDEIKKQFECFQTGNGTEASPYQLSSLSALESLKNYLNETDSFQIYVHSVKNLHFELTADIDFQNVKWDSIVNFDGILDGNQHYLSNIELSDSGFIKNLYYGSVENLNFKNVTYINQENYIDDDYFGMFVSHACHANIKNVNLEEYLLKAKLSTNYDYHIGALIGLVDSDSSVSNCAVSGVSDFVTSDEGHYSGLTYWHCGGVIGQISAETASGLFSKSEITVTSTDVNIYTPLYIGGITGSGNTLRECTSDGNLEVKIDYNDSEVCIGGIAGWAVTVEKASNKTNITCDMNNGKDSTGTGTKNIAGIVGEADAVTNCLNLGNISAKIFCSALRIGGIAGLGTASKCINIGNVVATNPSQQSSDYAFASGISPFSNVSESLSTGTISAYTAAFYSRNQYAKDNRAVPRTAYASIRAFSTASNPWTYDNCYTLNTSRVSYVSTPHTIDGDAIPGEAVDISQLQGKEFFVDSLGLDESVWNLSDVDFSANQFPAIKIDSIPSFIESATEKVFQEQKDTDNGENGNEQSFVSNLSDLSYSFSDENDYAIFYTRANLSSTTVIIGNTWRNVPVAQIDPFAFENDFEIFPSQADVADLECIKIPSSIRYIMQSAFSGCTGVHSIYYQGTKEEWNAIDKKIGWNTDLSHYTIYCSDGNIEVN